MSPPRAVIFDLDDTLIVDEEITRGAFLEAGKAAAASHPGLDIATFAASARQAAERIFAAHTRAVEWDALGIAASELLWADFSDPEVAAWAPQFQKETFAAALAAMGHVGDGSLEARIFARARRTGERLMPGAIELLGLLRGQCRLGLLTNGDSGVQRGKLLRSGLSGFFDAVAVSAEEGVGKPHPEIFRAILSRLGVTAGEAAMVGNSLARDIAGARAAGLAAAVWLRIPGAEEFAQALPTHTLSSLAELPATLGLATMAARPIHA